MKIEDIEKIFKDYEKIEKINSYFYVNHKCNEKTKKINLSFKISNDFNDKIIKFNLCDDCKTLFYNENFESKDF